MRKLQYLLRCLTKTDENLLTPENKADYSLLLITKTIAQLNKGTKTKPQETLDSKKKTKLSETFPIFSASQLEKRNEIQD